MANHTDTAGLLTRIHEVYGIPAFRIKPFGPVWKISTPDGEYGLKSLKLSAEQIRDLAGFLAKLTKAGFPHLARILTTKKGAAWFEEAGRNYILSPWYDGENPDFRDREHLTQVAHLFGKLHSISAQFEPPNHSYQQAGLLKYQDRTEFLRGIFGTEAQRVCSPQPPIGGRRGFHQFVNRIDRGILKIGPHFLTQVESCAQALTSLISNESRAREYELPGFLPTGFCHHDPGARNLIRYGGELILIDFELSGRDLFIYELTTLLNRSLEANQWEPDIFDLIMNAYEMERPLIAAELKILPYLLLFPQRFWRICRQRYHEELRWTEQRFARRLHQIIAQESNRLRFLERWFPQVNESCLW